MAKIRREWDAGCVLVSIEEVSNTDQNSQWEAICLNVLNYAYKGREAIVLTRSPQKTSSWAYDLAPGRGYKSKNLRSGKERFLATPIPVCTESLLAEINAEPDFSVLTMIMLSSIALDQQGELNDLVQTWSTQDLTIISKSDTEHLFREDDGLTIAWCNPKKSLEEIDEFLEPLVVEKGFEYICGSSLFSG